MNLRKSLYRKEKNYALMAFLLGILFASLFFIPNMIAGNGYFVFYGDFNAQQIPFYQMVHDSILNGDTMWSNTTDLGANLVGSYSFYLLGSPFFWITLLFPSGAVPYLMGPLLILKIACASLTSYLFLQRYVKNKSTAVFGALLYAFSGFSVYNVFFNHFHEAILIFPLLLYSIDEYMYKKRKGIVALSVFLACTMNYYFFVGQVVFVIIYWVLRICTKTYPKIKFKELLILAFEVVIGFLMTAVILLPSILSVIQNNRLSEWPNGWNAVVYDTPQKYVHIIESFFFPPDIAARPNFTPDSGGNWASIAGWLPLVGMTGVIGFLQTKEKHWLKKLIPLLIVIALVPIFNAAFQGFNMYYYARWFYMFDLILVLATVMSIENTEIDWLKATRISAGVTVVILLLVGLMPTTSEDDKKTTLGLENYPEWLWIYGSIALISMCGFVFILKAFAHNRKKMMRMLTLALALVVAVYGNYLVYLGVLQSNKDFIIDYSLNGGKDLNIDDIKNVRSDFYECTDNLGMYWQIPNIQAFQSIVPGSIMDFYPTFDSARDVASRPDTELYGLRGLLSVKYLFDNPSDDENFIDEDGNTKMPGFKYLDTRNGVNIYENQYYVPMGFMYNDFISSKEFKDIPTNNRDKALMKAMVLSEKQMKKYSSITGYKEINDDYSYTSSKADSFTYNENSYKKDCENRKNQSCKNFKYINNGFTATIDNKGKDNLVFFSVPYEDGWSAYVNGKEVNIEKVNVSFMAVKVDGNSTSEIKFTYKTPGLSAGFAITLISGVIYIGYIGFLYYRKRKVKK